MKQTIVTMMMALAFMLAAPFTMAAESVSEQGPKASNAIEQAPKHFNDPYGEGDKEGDDKEGEDGEEDDEEDKEDGTW